MAAAVEVNLPGDLTIPVAPADIERAVAAVFEREGVDDGSISITFLPDDEIAAMNEAHLGHAGPTDVISFPLHVDGLPVVGDVYIGHSQARRQAEEHEVPVGEEILRLAIHATLHVLGYEHPEGEGRAESEMYRIQEEILARVMAEGGR